MTRMIPQVLYGPVYGQQGATPEADEAPGAEANPRCVSCALEGTSRPLAMYFLVSGTSYCETHALVAAQQGATEGS